MYELRLRKFRMSGIDRKYLDVYEVLIMVECTCKYVAKTHRHPIVCVCVCVCVCVKIQGFSVFFL